MFHAHTAIGVKPFSCARMSKYTRPGVAASVAASVLAPRSMPTMYLWHIDIRLPCQTTILISEYLTTLAIASCQYLKLLKITRFDNTHDIA